MSTTLTSKTATDEGRRLLHRHTCQTCFVLRDTLKAYVCGGELHVRRTPLRRHAGAHIRTTLCAPVELSPSHTPYASSTPLAQQTPEDGHWGWTLVPTQKEGSDSSLSHTLSLSLSLPPSLPSTRTLSLILSLSHTHTYHKYTNTHSTQHKQKDTQAPAASPGTTTQIPLSPLRSPPPPSPSPQATTHPWPSHCTPTTA